MPTPRHFLEKQALLAIMQDAYFKKLHESAEALTEWLKEFRLTEAFVSYQPPAPQINIGNIFVHISRSLVTTCVQHSLILRTDVRGMTIYKAPAELKSKIAYDENGYVSPEVAARAITAWVRSTGSVPPEYRM